MGERKAINREKDGEAFLRLLDIMDRLRLECPWDKEQTMESLTKNTIEECYELVDAVVSGAPEEIQEELGDLMLHVVFYAKIAEEKGWFGVGDSINFLCDKLIYRHPHVFKQEDNGAQTSSRSSEEVKQSWEQLKQRENGSRRAVLSGVPSALPAMTKAYRIGEKAAAAGFDWEKKEDVWAKVKEELEEVEAEMRAQELDLKSRVEDEFGDLFFALINAARLYGVEPEVALERCNKRFISRFNYVEQRAVESNSSLSELPLEQMEEWWQMAKSEEKK